jgi:quinoprotein glucose dehydrogenase
MENENPPPKMLGGLMASLGLVLAAAGGNLTDAEGGGSYFIAVGLCLVVSGALLYLGKKLALLAYAATLAVVWIWSLKQSGGDSAEWLPRVALPTLVGIYVFSSRVRQRLY